MRAGVRRSPMICYSPGHERSKQHCVWASAGASQNLVKELRGPRVSRMALISLRTAATLRR
jgi:hypothetical protein